MFGERRYLDMFVELYVSTMRHMQVRRWAQQDTAVLRGSVILDLL